jgi:hypothetical protein
MSTYEIDSPEAQANDFAAFQGEPSDDELDAMHEQAATALWQEYQRDLAEYAETLDQAAIDRAEQDRADDYAEQTAIDRLENSWLDFRMGF